MAKAKPADGSIDLKALIQRVRPITGGEDGLASLAFSKGGRLYSYYRNVLLSTPVPAGFPEFCVKADSLLKAATATSKLSISDTRLTLTSGKIKTWLQLDKEAMLPEPTPSTDFVQVPDGLITVMKELVKFIPNEAPRIWATSLLLKGQFAYATNGSYIVRQRLAVQLPFTCALPKALVAVLAKLAKPMATMAFDGYVLYITFADGSRLSSPVYAEPWPDVSDFFLAEDMVPVDQELVEFLEQVKPYAAEADGVRVEFIAPNEAKFQFGETGAHAKFEGNWIPINFATSLNHMWQFISAGADIVFKERFAIVRYPDRTIVIAAKAKG